MCVLELFMLAKLLLKCSFADFYFLFYILFILIAFLYFQIAVNGQHCWEFPHRIPYTRVSSVFIEGTVQIERIEFIDKRLPVSF